MVYTFKAAACDIMTRRDCAKQLSAKFNKEIQSDHFGQGTTLSMEGCFVEYLENGEVLAHFHSHMADKSNQDAASTHAHMQVLLKLLARQKKIRSGCSTIWEHTDGCTKQYRCAKALHLLSYLATEFDITIDRQIDAPGHGKDVVDGLNAQDKVYLRKAMITADKTNKTDSADNNKLKMDPAVVDGDNKAISFAKQCVKLCSDHSRKKGAVSHKKSKKREHMKKMQERFYHYQDFDNVEFKDTKYSLSGFEVGDHNGIMGHYNFCFEENLGLGYCAAHCIPCACTTCIEKLKVPWDCNIDRGNQPRYSQNKGCVNWNIFQGLNDWRLICTYPRNANTGEVQKVKRSILSKYCKGVSRIIEIGETAAYAVDDESADGFYLVKWTSGPYIDHESKQLVADAVFYDKIPQCNYIYYIMEEKIQVRVQYVIVTGIVMPTITQTNEFPKKVGNKKIKQSYIDKGAFTIDKSDLEEIHQEIRRRDTLDYVEDDEEEESDQDSNDNDGD